MNRSQMADTGAERLFVAQRVRYMRGIVSDIEGEQQSRDRAYRAALRNNNRIKAALGVSTPRRSVKSSKSPRQEKVVLKPGEIVGPGDQRFRILDSQWNQRHHKMINGG